jgi:drug/metabolite transporter (DMT)-like permease
MKWIIKKIIWKAGIFCGIIKSEKRAVILGIAAALCFSVMAFLVKLVADRVTESMTVFFRFAVSLFWVISVLSYKRWRGKYFSLKTKRPGLYLLRAFSGFIAMFAFYIALSHVPLVSASLLAMTYALFIPILSFMFLGAKTSAKSWLALGVGFVGIIFILKPGGSAFNPWALLALITGLAAAISYLSVHELAKEDDVYTIMFYYFPLTFVLSGILSMFNWRTPDLRTILILLVMGIVGAAHQELLTRALLYASPKIISPLMYLSVVFSGFLGWLFWGHIPDLFFLCGMVLVVLGCIFSIIYAKETLPPAP